jgi:hypothetical protein
MSVIAIGGKSCAVWARATEAQSAAGCRDNQGIFS